MLPWPSRWQAPTSWQGSPCKWAAGGKCRRGAHASAWGCVQLETGAQPQQAAGWLQSSAPTCIHMCTPNLCGAACRVSIRPVAVVQEWGKRSSAWASLIQPGQHSAVTLDRPLTAFEVCCGLLVPLYVGRALEEAYFGKDARTLMTSDEVGG